MAVEQDKQNSQIPVSPDLMKLAIESVGSEILAKQLLSDKLKDAYLLKIRIRIENRIGLLMILISMFSKRILAIYSIAGNTKTLDKTDPIEEQSRFCKSFLEIAIEPGVDFPLSETIGRAAYYCFADENLEKSINGLENNDYVLVIENLEKKIKEQTNANSLDVTGDMEKVSSVKLRSSIPADGKLKPINSPLLEALIDTEIKPPKGPIERADKNSVEEYLKMISPRFSQVLRVKTILAPTDGVGFSDLIKDEIIYFKAVVSTKEQKQVAEELGFVSTDGRPVAVEGQFLDLIKNANEEYHIFAIGPENTLLYSVDRQELKISVKNKRKKADLIASQKTGLFESPLILVGLFILFVLFLVFLFV